MAAWRYDIYLLVLKKILISLVRCAHSWNIFQHSKINVVYPRDHVISYIYVINHSEDLLLTNHNIHLFRKLFKFTKHALVFYWLKPFFANAVKTRNIFKDPGRTSPRTGLATLLNDVEWSRTKFDCQHTFDPTSFNISFVLRCEQQCWTMLDNVEQRCSQVRTAMLNNVVLRCEQECSTMLNNVLRCEQQMLNNVGQCWTMLFSSVNSNVEICLAGTSNN